MDGHGERPERRPTIEWVVGILSGAVVAVLIGFLSAEAMFGGGGPPELSVAVERLEPVDGGTRVVVAVSNRGDEAAAEVGVSATVARDGDASPPRELRFDYVAAHATRRGAFLIGTPNLAESDLRVEVLGYVEP